MSQKQKKGQKYDRNRKRPSGASQQFRTMANKAKKIRKAAKQREADKIKVRRIPRGTARAKRRAATIINAAATQGETS